MQHNEREKILPPIHEQIARLHNRQRSGEFGGIIFAMGGFALALADMQAIGNPSLEAWGIGFGVTAAAAAIGGFTLLVDARRAKGVADKLECQTPQESIGQEPFFIAEIPASDQSSGNPPQISENGVTDQGFQDQEGLTLSYPTEIYLPYEAGYTGQNQNT